MLDVLKTPAPPAGATESAPETTATQVVVDEKAPASETSKGEIAHAAPPGHSRFAALYADSALATRKRAEVDDAMKPSANAAAMESLKSASLYAAPFWRQFLAIMQRHWRETLRVRDFTAIRLFVLLFLTVFYGMIWNGVAANLTSQTAVFSTLGVIVFGSSFAGIITFVTGGPVYALQRPVFYREKAGSYYRPEAFTAAMLITELPWIVLAGLGYLVIMYGMVSLAS